ncbi:hypothetical protein [Streptomyces sp. NPDC005374]|uniref:hypothetical protein n=1 Tax=Streptomyces sp. NPDC005374 TaxID=3364713 RepID=UPI0036BDE9E2
MPTRSSFTPAGHVGISHAAPDDVAQHHERGELDTPDSHDRVLERAGNLIGPETVSRLHEVVAELSEDAEFPLPAASDPPAAVPEAGARAGTGLRPALRQP